MITLSSKYFLYSYRVIWPTQSQIALSIKLADAPISLMNSYNFAIE